MRGCHTSYWSRKMCSCCTLMRRSVSLNSYGTFQPNGPKFRLSCTSAWKKQRPYSNVLNSALKPNATQLIIHGWFKEVCCLVGVFFFPKSIHTESSGSALTDLQSYNTPLLTGFLQLSKKPGSDIGSIRYDRIILARKPFGASLVIFTPF